MGSSGNSDGMNPSFDRTQVADVDCDDTLPFDSQLSPSSFSGGRYDVSSDSKWQHLEDTVPLDDDAFETQPVNLAGETQVLDDVDDDEDIHTQLLDDEEVAIDTHGDGTDRTEVLENVNELFSDYPQHIVGAQSADDVDDDEDIHTQLLDDEEVAIDTHGDRTDKTEVLENVNELSSDYPQHIVGAQSAKPKQVLCEPFCTVGEKKLLEKTDAVINQGISSGSRPPRFTYIRVESLREAALSTRDTDLKQTKDETNSVMGMGQAQEPLSVKNDEEPFPGCTEKTREVDMEYDHWEYRREAEGVFNKSKSKISSSAVRKLFNDDLPAEKKGCSLDSNDVNGGEGLAELSIYDDELVGLSYVNSQEPGELSQANALDVVDRLLKDNVLESDQGPNSVKNVQENSKTFSSLKGQQSLAKRANGSGNAGKAGIYDWDDSREDEGGGDIFRRRKNEFLEAEMHRRKSLPGVLKNKVSRPDSNSKNGEEKLSNHNKGTREVNSDSRLLLHNLKVRDDTVKETTKKSRRNIVNDLDEQFNINSSRVQLEPNATAADPQGTIDVGLDTQMAAEAMEALGNCEGIGIDVANEATRSSLTDLPDNTSTGPIRSITSKKCSGQYDSNCKKDKVMRRSKRNMLNVEDNVISGVCENSSKLPSQAIEQSKSAGASKRHKVNELNNCTVSERENGGNLVNKKHLQNQDCRFTPVAYRTRRNLVANQLLKPNRLSRNLREEDGRVDSPEKRSSSSGILASKALVGSSSPSVQSEEVGLSAARKRKMRTDARSVFTSHRDCHTQSASHSISVGSSIDQRQKQISDLNLGQANYVDTPSKSSDVASATPDNCRTPGNDASPVCMGDKYYKQSCNRELRRELCSLSDRGLGFTPPKDLRKRRDMTDVRILYSQHLDEDIIKHQKKILARLGVSVATSIVDATHFIADQFVRTRNMLEAIASGKPVVTHLWIESCGQTSCLIDEKNYILRDVKKEKEFGFSMPVSLARATHLPLLEGRRVFITPNTKPSKEIVSSLVKAVRGVAVERIGRSLLKDDKIQDDLLILSCEEDYASCVPFLEKGAAVYSSELLLNGIVTQKLEYERYRLFAEHVKKTRSTIWLKGDGGTYRRVSKCK